MTPGQPLPGHPATRAVRTGDPPARRRRGAYSPLCRVASLRARSRERRAGPVQPQLQTARQNEPRSAVLVMWPGAGCTGSAG
ncbi:hypothetical protein [Streptomyces lavendulae]|uniref:hypothetical protein n=1 Tax=Streptomyces lavendulae TaxID=1914 RepID=UPI0031EF64D6